MANIGGAIISGPQAYLQNTLLSYQRGQEESADRAGVRFLTMTGQSAKGMYDTFKRFADESLFSAHSIDPYAQTIRCPPSAWLALAELVKTPYWDKKDSPELQFRHDMMRAKMYGFTDRPDAVLRRYPSTDNSMPARYARAISAYRFGDMHDAAAQIDALIASAPNNPYFHELKGQALLEGGHPAAAIAPLRHAAQLAPDPALIQITLAQALIATNDAKQVEEAIPLLRAALTKEPRRPTPICSWRWPMATRAIWPTRSGFGAGRLRPRRQQDGTAARRPSQGAFSHRIARLGARRRHSCFQQEPQSKPAYKMITGRTTP